MNRDNHIMLKCWQHCVINVASTIKDKRCGLCNRESSVIINWEQAAHLYSSVPWHWRLKVHGG